MGNDYDVDRKRLEQLFQEREIESVAIVASDLNGIARGKVVPVQKVIDSDSPIRMSKIFSMLGYGSFPFPPPDNDDRWWPSWDEGYQDVRAVVDPDTARNIPWRNHAGLVSCDYEHRDERGSNEHLPRATASRILARARKRGYTVKAAQDLEFTLFDETVESAAEKQYENIKPLWRNPQGMSFGALNRHDETISTFVKYLEEFGLPPDAWSLEGGPGQVELNLPPSDGLKSADDA